MLKDKYSAIWLSYSSIKDFLNCPKAYFLKNIFKNPKTGRKISLMKPPLALGQVIHRVLDEISMLPVEERLSVPLQERFKKQWQRISGEAGGFKNKNEEEVYRKK